ncbi:acyl-CoA dehydrogenase [Salipiger sp. IMCC34102]|uniref:acyl-CoA dehydrogenase n=1 Tax=Salipiger sp. IMCC34102 TaxID=2510647 RepID=UPI00101B778E|nr:acyl-CoA dehydrogenase [Salipiger sp. IMCC34102]RYH01345.1 acyl-CoA dehydrogenase [Salipiger sp. IMCC34102]
MGRHEGEPNAPGATRPDVAIQAVLDDLRAGADAAAHNSPDLGGPIDLLGKTGVLKSVLPPPDGVGLGWTPGEGRTLSDLLRHVGAADLALARLLEGHVNAAILVEIHGDGPARDAMRESVREGALLGVWGADGPEPLEWVDRAKGSILLKGSKIFASGLSHVDLAVVTARSAAGAPARMFLVPANDPARHDHASWTASAMRASRSGRFDATGLVLDETGCVGPAGALMTEPWFEGGV